MKHIAEMLEKYESIVLKGFDPVTAGGFTQIPNILLRTPAGLRAGKPSVICPFMADQPFWGKLIYQQHLGPEPIPQSKLNADRLAKAIHTAVNDQTIQHRAAEMGKKIRAEDGIARAVGIIGAVINERVRA